ncbi:MAG: lipoate--protein ligase family protein [Planctomycetes bacterium]|nr:lipoate--protein ligase family protein [Planctomycetota bacterium]
MQCQYIDYSCPNQAQNLALEEVLIQPFVKNPQLNPIIRVWQSDEYCIVLGRGEKIENQVYTEKAQDLNIPVYRRISGGGTVVQGPGNLNLSFFLPYHFISGLDVIENSYQIILPWVTQSLKKAYGAEVNISGTCDLTINGKKISGTAQARKRHGLLHHMTLLMDFDLAVVSKVLKEPEKRPEYRKLRQHEVFITDLKREGYETEKETFLTALQEIVPGQVAYMNQNDLPHQETLDLAERKYKKDEWNYCGKSPR